MGQPSRVTILDRLHRLGGDDFVVGEHRSPSAATRARARSRKRRTPERARSDHVDLPPFAACEIDSSEASRSSSCRYAGLTGGADGVGRPARTAAREAVARSSGSSVTACTVPSRRPRACSHSERPRRWRTNSVKRLDVLGACGDVVGDDLEDRRACCGSATPSRSRLRRMPAGARRRPSFSGISSSTTAGAVFLTLSTRLLHVVAREDRRRSRSRITSRTGA